MSDTPKPRTSQDAQAEYNNTLFRLGVSKRAAYEQEREAKMIEETLDRLQVEYNTLVQTEKRIADATAQAAAPKLEAVPS